MPAIAREANRYYCPIKKVLIQSREMYRGSRINNLMYDLSERFQEKPVHKFLFVNTLGEVLDKLLNVYAYLGNATLRWKEWVNVQMCKCADVKMGTRTHADVVRTGATIDAGKQ